MDLEKRWRSARSMSVTDASTRLVVSPGRRRQGIGKQLVSCLMEQGRKDIRRQEYSLSVCKDNHPAKACYIGMGFEETEYPLNDEMANTCLYMTRPVEKE